MGGRPKLFCRLGEFRRPFGPSPQFRSNVVEQVVGIDARWIAFLKAPVQVEQNPLARRASSLGSGPQSRVSGKDGCQHCESRERNAGCDAAAERADIDSHGDSSQRAAVIRLAWLIRFLVTAHCTSAHLPGMRNVARVAHSLRIRLEFELGLVSQQHGTQARRQIRQVWRASGTAAAGPAMMPSRARSAARTAGGAHGDGHEIRVSHETHSSASGSRACGGCAGSAAFHDASQHPGQAGRGGPGRGGPPARHFAGGSA